MFGLVAILSTVGCALGAVNRWLTVAEKVSVSVHGRRPRPAVHSLWTTAPLSAGRGTIDGVTSTASTVERAFRAALYDDTDTGLDTGASLLAADPAADAELTRRGEDFVATAWQRSWQPADVVRLVRRELDEAHVRLAAALIRAQAGRDRPRGRRWADQLAALPAGPERTADRFSHATAVLELYRLLLRLPALEPLEEESRRAPGPAASRMLHPHPRAARQGRGDRLPGGGGGAHRQGAGADGLAQRRRGAARRRGARAGRARCLPHRGGGAVRTGQGGPAGRGGHGEPLPRGVERTARLLHRRRLRGGPGGGRTAPTPPCWCRPRTP